MGHMIEVRLKEAAQARGVENSKQLADLMNCAPTIIWKIWTGVHDPKLPMLDRICEALDCDLSDLIVRKPRRRARPTNGHTSGLSRKQSAGLKRVSGTKAGKSRSPK